MSQTLEWWPDYGGRLFYLRDGPGGKPADLNDLPLTAATSAAIREWIADFDETKIPVDGPGEPSWLAMGVVLLARCRAELTPHFNVIVTEPWWAEDPAE